MFRIIFWSCSFILRSSQQNSSKHMVDGSNDCFVNNRNNCHNYRISVRDSSDTSSNKTDESTEVGRKNQINVKNALFRRECREEMRNVGKSLYKAWFMSIVLCSDRAYLKSTAIKARRKPAVSADKTYRQKNLAIHICLHLNGADMSYCNDKLVGCDPSVCQAAAYKFF
jgi:hypothetical protein